MLRTVQCLAVLVALVSQLALGSVVLGDDAAGFLAAATVLCQTDDGTGHPPPTHHHLGDPCVCPLAMALALPAVLPTSAFTAAAPPAALILRDRGAVQARAPPSHIYAAAFPRGPPALV